MAAMAAARTTNWIWPLALVLVAAMGIGAALYVFRTIAAAPGAVVEQGQEALRGLREVAAAFSSGTITTSFSNYATEATGVSRLQVAELKQVELFEQTDEASLLWGQLELPDIVVRARAPVDYTYYVDLEKRWDFVLEKRRIRVHAPAIEFNRPAVDVSRLEYEVAIDSLLRDEEGALERLRSGITEMSTRRARQNLSLVRELARRETESFVRDWLGARFIDGDDYTIDVVFADEGSQVETRPAD